MHEAKQLLHTENRNAKITQICVSFTFGHGLAVHHSLNIAMVTFEVILDLYYRNALQYAFINHNLGCVKC